MVNGSPILHDSHFTATVLNEASELTKTAAFQIRETQPGTRYGVSKCAERIFDHLIQKTSMKAPLSTLVDEEHASQLGLSSPLFISLP